MFRFIDVFAGVGGLTEGFRAAVGSDGRKLFEPLLLVDSNAAARETQLRNNPRTRYIGADVEMLSGRKLRDAAELSSQDDLDVLIGGPPCQGFSRLNRLARRMLDDPRNAMFRKFLGFVREIMPKIVLIENVPNLLSFDGGRYDTEIFEFFEELGYATGTKVLAANEFGLPQLRKRAFVLAVRGDVGIDRISFPVGRFAPLQTAREVNAAVHGDEDAFFSLPFVSVEDAIGDLPTLAAGAEAISYGLPPLSDYQAARRRNSKSLANHTARSHAAAFVVKKLSKIPEGGSNQDLDGRSRFDRGRPIKYLSQAYGRLHRHGIAQTITAHFSNPGSGRFLHYRDNRSITVREAARFQGFDDNFVFCGKMQEQQKQVGNAVPPLLSRALAEEKIRRRLLNDGHIDTVIGLPANLFYSTGIPVCILVLKKCKQPDDVLFINAAEGFVKGKRQNQLTPAHIERITGTYQNRTEAAGYAKRVTMAQIAEMKKLGGVEPEAARKYRQPTTP